MSYDQYLDREYHATNYNCRHFVAEVSGWPIAWLDVPFQGWKRLAKPIDGCLALMRPLTGTAPHVGIYKGGRVLHLGEKMPRFEPIVSIVLHFHYVKYYARS